MIQVYFPSRYRSICSQTRIRVCLLVICVVGCVPAIPGIVENEFYRTSNCMLETSNDVCTARYRTILLLQTKIVPAVVVALPLLGSIVLVLIALNHYKPREIETNNERKTPQNPNGLSGFSDSSVQLLMTTVWFIVYHLTSVMLLLIIDASDGGYLELKGARGLIKTSLMFRALNLPINLYVNLLCGKQFRKELKAILLCRFEVNRSEQDCDNEIEESRSSHHRSHSI